MDCPIRPPPLARSGRQAPRGATAPQPTDGARSDRAPCRGACRNARSGRLAAGRTTSKAALGPPGAPGPGIGHTAVRAARAPAAAHCRPARTAQLVVSVRTTPARCSPEVGEGQARPLLELGCPKCAAGQRRDAGIQAPSQTAAATSGSMARTSSRSAGLQARISTSRPGDTASTGRHRSRLPGAKRRRGASRGAAARAGYLARRRRQGVSRRAASGSESTNETGRDVAGRFSGRGPLADRTRVGFPLCRNPNGSRNSV